MTRSRPRLSHPEGHRTARIGWLRAAVLGANDGIISLSSLLVGIAATKPEHSQLVIGGVAGLVAGALSMAAGEYVSVSSQADTEEADLERERMELQTQPELEKRELAGIYVARGLSAELALQVAEALTSHDALQAHSRDELGLSDVTKARPLQAAGASAASFAVGAALPVAITLAAQAQHVVALVTFSSLVFLGALGAIAARAGGAPPLRASVRVLVMGGLAMGTTAAIGTLFR